MSLPCGEGFDQMISRLGEYFPLKVERTYLGPRVSDHGNYNAEHCSTNEEIRHAGAGCVRRTRLCFNVSKIRRSHREPAMALCLSRGARDKAKRAGGTAVRDDGMAQMERLRSSSKKLWTQGIGGILHCSSSGTPLGSAD